MNPEYMSPLFFRSIIPYNLRDKSKLIQPLKRTTTYGIKSHAYYGKHLWKLLPLDVKGAITLKIFSKHWWKNARVQLAVVQYVRWSLNLRYKAIYIYACEHVLDALVYERPCLHAYIMRAIYTNTCIYHVIFIIHSIDSGWWLALISNKGWCFIALLYRLLTKVSHSYFSSSSSACSCPCLGPGPAPAPAPAPDPDPGKWNNLFLEGNGQ